MNVVDVLNLLFTVLGLAGMIVAGACVAIFNRQYIEYVLRFQKRVFRIEFGDASVKLFRIMSVVIGAALVFTGLAFAVQFVAQLNR